MHERAPRRAEADRPAPESPFVVGAANDPAESRADSFAQRAAASRGYEIRRSSRATSTPGAIGLGGGPLDTANSDRLQSRLGKGERLDSSLASEFRELGASQADSARIHHDSHAHDLASAMSANAFTVGSDIFFAQGMYQPDTDSGHRMLAHELGHVGDGADVHRDVIRRDVGFEFETNVVVRKEIAGKKNQTTMVPLAKMEKLGNFGHLSVEADENSQLGSTIEFVIEHVREDDRAGLERALDKMFEIADDLTAAQVPDVPREEMEKFKRTDKEYKAKNKQHTAGQLSGKELFEVEQRYRNRQIHDDPNRPLLNTVVAGAPANVHFTPVRKGGLTANPQVTAGIKPDKLHEVMSGSDGKPSKSASRQRRKDAHDWLVSAASGKQTVARAAEVKDLKLGGNDASPALKGLVTLLITYLKNGTGNDPLNYAKLIAGAVMARTDFSNQFILIPGKEQNALRDNHGQPFADLVLGAAGMPGTGATKVFERGVRAAQKASDPAYNQRVQVLESITREEWLRGIPRGFDALSAKQAKLTGEDALASELEGLGRLGTKTDEVGNEVADNDDARSKGNPHPPGSGIVVEFRGIRGNLDHTEWKDKALAAFDYLVRANQG